MIYIHAARRPIPPSATPLRSLAHSHPRLPSHPSLRYPTPLPRRITRDENDDDDDSDSGGTPPDTEPEILCRWLEEGVFDALDKRYLRQIVSALPFPPVPFSIPRHPQRIFAFALCPSALPFNSALQHGASIPLPFHSATLRQLFLPSLPSFSPSSAATRFQPLLSYLPPPTPPYCPLLLPHSGLHHRQRERRDHRAMDMGRLLRRRRDLHRVLFHKGRRQGRRQEVGARQQDLHQQVRRKFE